LHKKKVISDEWQENLDQMWAERHSFHYLRPSVESDQRKVKVTARNTQSQPPRIKIGQRIFHEI